MKRGDSIFPDFGVNVTMFETLPKKRFSRSIDSPTSKKAVSIPRIKGELKTVLNAVDKMITGFTAKELSSKSGLNYIMVSKRLSVLQKYGYVTKDDRENPNAEIRNNQMVWRRFCS